MEEKEIKDCPVLYRKRIIPNECIRLENDIVIKYTDEIIVTKWQALRPKRDLDHGYSCYFLNRGFKVSKFYRADNTLLYWYCDIVSYDLKKSENELVVTDLLADVKVYPDGFVKVVDLDELAVALDSKDLTIEQMKNCLVQLDELLRIIYDDKFDTLTQYIDEAEK